MERVNADSGSVAQVDVPVTEFWDRTYLPHFERTTKPSTLNGYCKLWGQHLVLHLASFTLRDYKTADATRLLTSFAESGLGTRTSSAILVVLSPVFQFTVAPPQHFLYFFPEPQGHGSFRPTLGLLRRDSELRAPASVCCCSLKYRYACNSPAAMCTITSSRCSGLIGLGRIFGSVSCS